MFEVNFSKLLKYFQFRFFLIIQPFRQILKAVSRKFTLIRGVNFKISPDFGPHICKQTGQKSKSNCKHINILRNLKFF